MHWSVRIKPWRPQHLLKTGILLLFILCSEVRAQQPFYTDDADVTPRGHLHLEFSNEYDWLQHSSFPNLRQNTADLELDYGLFKDVEVGIESPLLAIYNSNETTPHMVAGIGDTNLSLKYNFHRETSRLPALSIALNLELPTGNTSRQLGSGLSDFYMNGVVQKSLNEKTKLRLNGGILFSGNTTTGVIGIKSRGIVVTGGGSLVKQFTDRFDLGVEVTGALTKNLQLGKGQLQALVGGNYAVRRNVTFDFGIVAGKYAASPRTGIQLGVSVDF